MVRTTATAAAAPTPVVHLAGAASGDCVRVVSVAVEHVASLAREGIAPGSRLSVESIVPFGGPVIVACGGARVALGRSVARGVGVEPA